MIGRHYITLDGLRGVAIALVLVIHFFSKELFVQQTSLELALGRLAGLGGYGVELFFTLSGFLITGILLDTRNTKNPLSIFYARRFLRIFPLYYLTLAVVFLVVPLFVPPDPGALELHKHQFWLWTYLANLPFLPWVWDDSSQFLLGHFWSLCVEEQFYLVWPFVVLYTRPSNLARICIAMAALSLTCRILDANSYASGFMSFAQWSTLKKLDGLALGSLLAVAQRHFPSRIPGSLFAKCVGVCLFVIILGVTSLPRSVQDGEVLAVLGSVIVGFCAIVLLESTRSAPGELMYRTLSLPPLVFLGKYSYGLYVVHGVLRPQIKSSFNYLGLNEWMSIPIAQQSLYYAYATTVSLALTYVVFHCFEKPFLNLKRFVGYERSGRQ